MGSLYRYPPSSSCNIRRRSGAPSVPDISLLAERLPERTRHAESGVPASARWRPLILAAIAGWVFLVCAAVGAWRLMTELFALFSRLL
jgi:hypothetical protein